MGWKEKYVNKLNKNTVISEFGGKKVYLAKDKIFGEWKQIYPAVDENTLKVNRLNLLVGGWRNLVKLIFVLVIVVMVFLQFKENFDVINYYREVCEPLFNLGKTIITP